MKVIKYLFVFSCLFLFHGIAYGQGKALKKADTFYKLNQYSAAIPHYEAFLSKKDNLSAKTKLAYCYRMTNQLAPAAKLYSEIVKEERASTISKFYYAESLMGIEKYDDAKGWFEKYLSERPEDKQAMAMLKACKEVKYIQPYFQNIKSKNFTQNSDTDDSAPVLYKDGLVFCSDRRQGVNVLKKKSGWTGRDFLSVYFSKRNADDTFEPADNFSRKINEINKNTGPVTFNREGNIIIFTQNSSVVNNREQYPMQLYISTAEEDGKWKSKELIPFCSPNYNYMHPALSPDGQRLFFISDKKGGEGGTDLFFSERTERGWTRPQNLGPQVNTASNEAFPFVHEDGKLYFSSKGHVGYGGFDIFFSEQQADGSWSAPVNVGKPINSSTDDISIAIAPDNKSGAFSSSRKNGDDDIYLFKTSGGNTSAPYSITLMDEEEPLQPVTPPISEKEAPKEEISATEVIEESLADSSSPQQTIEQAVAEPKAAKVESTTVKTAKPTAKSAETQANNTKVESSFGYEIEAAPTPTPKAKPDYTETTLNDPVISKNDPPTNPDNLLEMEKKPSTANPANDNRQTEKQVSTEPIVNEEKSKEVVQSTPPTKTPEYVKTEAAPTSTPKAKPDKKEITLNDLVISKNDPPASPGKLMEMEKKPSTANPANDNRQTEKQASTEPIVNEEKSKEAVQSTPPTKTPEYVATEAAPKTAPVIDMPVDNSEVKEPVLKEASEEVSAIDSVDPTEEAAEAEKEFEKKNVEKGNTGRPVETSSPIVEGKRINTAPTMYQGTIAAENTSTTEQSNSSEETPLVVRDYTDLGYALSVERATVGQTFQLPNISYTFDAFEYQVNDKIAAELNKLAAILKENPELKLEIGGHTSSFGEDRVNLEISRERAEAAVRYLIENGIAGNRLVSRGYGETQPLNHCVNGVLCTRAEHLENQRLEIKVLKK